MPLRVAGQSERTYQQKVTVPSFETNGKFPTSHVLEICRDLEWQLTDSVSFEDPEI